MFPSVMPILISAVLLLARPCQAERPPNVVFVLADDLGWRELGCYGNGFNETPHLDLLAQQGMRFTQAYAAAPVCSPYRASLLTGQLPARHGILDYLRPDSGRPLPRSQQTIAERLRARGYATGMIGKWHLSGYEYHGAEFEIRATDHGFEEELCSELKGIGNGANTFPYVFRTQPVPWVNISRNRLGSQEYLTDRLNREAVDFIDRHKDRPFFLYLAHYAPHTILSGRESLVEKYRRKHPPGKSTRERCYLCQDQGHAGDTLNHWAGDHNPHLAAMLESIDSGIGMLAVKLKELGLAENTIFIFTSDNGGETNVTSNKPLRGGKSQLYEGGIRVPMIVRWPSQVPENAVNRQPTVNVDFYPTLLEVLGEQPIEKQLLDGVSILSTLKDPTQTPRRNALYWHYPLDRPHFLGGVSAGAVRKGNWKLIEFYETGKTELYSLGDDPGEHSDLSAEQPETTAGLKAELANWRKTIGARIPSSPIMSETRKLVFEDSFDPVSSRWFFQKFWSVEDGVLKRNSFPAGNQRIFLRKPVFKDTLIRFDFRFDGAREIRLMTGTPGKYNAVIHIRPTDFLIQTARDQSVPYYPTFQGECLQDFQTGQWYTMTVEIVGEEIVVHTDHAHVSVASHPILDRERSYFAFQVDQPGASFDNVEILSAVPQRDWPQRREKFIRAQSDRPGIRRAAGDQLKIEMTNLRDRLHRTDPQYRRLVADIDVQKTREHARFPDVFTTIKSVRKEIDGYRRRLIASDPDYKSLRNAVNAARRKEREYLLSQDPSIADRPSGRIEAAVERIRLKVRQADDYLALISSRERLERDLQKKYPRLFVTDQEILQAQREARTRRNSDQEFRAQLKATAAAVRAEREYLETVDSKLKKLSAEAARLKAAASQTR